MSKLIKLIPMLLVWSSLGAPSYAEHPVDVERLAAKGEYLRALVAYDKLPKRSMTNAAAIAAGRSAWGLALPERAIEEFDRVMRSDNLDQFTRARLLMSRGIIEFQEGRYQLATLYAEKAAILLTSDSPLRGKVYTLWAESLNKLGSYGQAEEKYEAALAEVPAEEQPDLHYLLATCQIKLNKLEEATKHLESVPLNHERTASAMRHLAVLALEQDKTSAAEFWLLKGRELFPDDFLDAWVDYILVKGAIERKDDDLVHQLQSQALSRFAPSDHWVTLLNAAVEEYSWHKNSPSNLQKDNSVKIETEKENTIENTAKEHAYNDN